MSEHLFEATIQKSHMWVNEVADELRLDSHTGYAALRAVLHALRDRLTVESVAQLGAQLPQLVRGFYYEGWRPSGKPLKEREKAEFLTHIRLEMAKTRVPNADPEQVAKAVFKVLTANVTIGEIEDVIAVLPHGLKDLWPTMARGARPA